MSWSLVFSGLIGLPVSSVPCVSAVNPVAVASYVIVRLLGVGPGTYLDLARFSFHVPTRGSVSAETTDATRPIAHTANTPRTSSFNDFIASFLSDESPSWDGRVSHRLPRLTQQNLYGVTRPQGHRIRRLSRSLGSPALRVVRCGLAGHPQTSEGRRPPSTARRTWLRRATGRPGRSPSRKTARTSAPWKTRRRRRPRRASRHRMADGGLTRSRRPPPVRHQAACRPAPQAGPPRFRVQSRGT